MTTNTRYPQIFGYTQTIDSYSRSGNCISSCTVNRWFTTKDAREAELSNFAAKYPDTARSATRVTRRTRKNVKVYADTFGAVIPRANQN